MKNKGGMTDIFVATTCMCCNLVQNAQELEVDDINCGVGLGKKMSGSEGDSMV